MTVPDPKSLLNLTPLAKLPAPASLRPCMFDLAVYDAPLLGYDENLSLSPSPVLGSSPKQLITPKDPRPGT